MLWSRTGDALERRLPAACDPMQDEPDAHPGDAPTGVAPEPPTFRPWGTWAFTVAYVALMVSALVAGLRRDAVAQLVYPEQVAVRGALRPLEALRGLSAAQGSGGDVEEREPDVEEGGDSPAAEGDEGSGEDALDVQDVMLQRSGAASLRAAAEDLEATAERRARVSSPDSSSDDGGPDDASEAAPRRTRQAPPESAELLAIAARLRARAAALLAELGDEDWREPIAGLPVDSVWVELLDAAYADGPVPSRDRLEAARELGDDPGALALRRAVSAAGDDADRVFELEQLARRRADSRFNRLVQLGGRLLPALFAGLGLLAVSVFLPRDAARVGAEPSPAGTFALDDSWAVFVRYVVLFQLIGSALAISAGSLFGGYEVLFASLPLLGLVQLVAMHRGRALADLVGIDVDISRPLRFVPVVLVGWVTCLFLLLGVMPLVSGLVGGTPWANPILDLSLAPDFDPAGLMRSGVLWAPIFEELAFRGVLFAGLRGRLGFVRAALASSLLFGFAHSYDLAGNLAITGVGFVLCMVYERSKSLLPCIFVHALFNYAQLAFLLRMYG